MVKKNKGARAKLRKYFLDHVGEKLDSNSLRKVAGISEWVRRIRELRCEEGLEILTHNDRSDLKPGEYILTSKLPKPAFERHPYDKGRKNKASY